MDTQTDPEASGSPLPGFWAGYRLWLQGQWRVLYVVLALSVLLFLLGLWLGSADQDPFQYEIF